MMVVRTHSCVVDVLELLLWRYALQHGLFGFQASVVNELGLMMNRR